MSDIYCHAQEVADEAGSESVVMYVMWYTRALLIWCRSVLDILSCSEGC